MPVGGMGVHRRWSTSVSCSKCRRSLTGTISFYSILIYFQRFLSAYKQALEFRMSHYFICYLSTFVMHLGVPAMATPVVNFWAIEAPRNMKEVVRSWNMPMHSFLKKCKRKATLFPPFSDLILLPPNQLFFRRSDRKLDLPSPSSWPLWSRPDCTSLKHASP